jgi:hypothetical protein
MHSAPNHRPTPTSEPDPATGEHSAHPSPAFATPPPPPLHNSTRHLAAGAHLDNRFRDRLLYELLGDRFRAVAPSLGGFDVVPVLRHALYAERVALIRDAAGTVLLTGALVLSAPLTLSWLFALLPLALLTLPRIRYGARVWRVLLVLWAVTALYPIAVVTALNPLFPTRVEGFDLSTGALVERTSLAWSVALPVAFLLAAFGVALGHWIARHLAVAQHLRPGAAAVPYAVPAQVRDRVAYVGQAQWGNVTLHGEENPFVGAGPVHRSWTVTVPLGPATRFDVVELHRFVGHRLLEMRDAVESPPERLHRLHVGDHLMARGTFTRSDWPTAPGLRDQSHPLIDTGTGLPYFAATPETVEAAIRHPQGGIRHYQRITVGAEGSEVRNASGVLLAPAEDQQTVVSAFIALSVEGGMLHTRFVATVLPPARTGFQVADLLAGLGKGAVVWTAVKRVRLGLLADVVFAPVRLARTAARLLRRGAEAASPAVRPVYPYGARTAARELGSAPRPPRGSPRYLDADKHVKLIEYRLSEAVADYLQAHDVDPTDYRYQTTAAIL